MAKLKLKIMAMAKLKLKIMAMANPSHSLLISPLSFLKLLCVIFLLSLSPAISSPQFEGFDDNTLEADDSLDDSPPIQLPDPPPVTQSDPLTHFSAVESEPSDPPPAPAPPDVEFEVWDEDEFEGIPTDSQPPPELPQITPNATAEDSQFRDDLVPKLSYSSFMAEYLCGAFLIMFIINYFTGRRENEKLAVSWATRFAIKDSIFEKNFTLVGVGDGEDSDSPLLLKEGHSVFKFYAIGRRFCQGMLATMELKRRHDLISRVYDEVVQRKDEISFEVCMNEDAMDQVVFAIARKKAVKGFMNELPDVKRFGLVASSPSNRKWVTEELAVVSKSKEVAGDLITETVLDQVFGEKAFEKFGKSFISMHFSDQHPGIHKKKLIFKFALPDTKHVADMTRLVALVPYYIDLVGRYKLSSQARSKTDAARVKAAQEAHKALQNARQEALQKKKAERKKMMGEIEAQLSAEAIRRKEAKERARLMKAAVPKTKVTRAH